nr:Shedu anti-phage system protein SduA domain-containing protein [Kribbella sandramycini]
MPETHFPDALTAVPLVTLGRRGRAWAKEISELEVLINDPSVREHDLQAFFEANPQFLSGVDYDRVVPHPVLTRDEGGPLIPDFMLEVTGGAADVLDLKLPTARLVTGSRDRRRFGRVVQDALAQVREYGAYFDLPANRQRVAERYGLQAYRPQLTVVIGRSSTSDDPLHLRRLWSEIPPRSRIMTYDELLERVKRLERMRWF